MTTVTTSPTRFVSSPDGTRIAYDVTGSGPAVVVVEGALCQRSMGTAKALEAARAGVPMRKLAVYEAPFIVDDSHAPNDPELGRRTQRLVESGRRSEAVRLFMRTVGVPAPAIAMMRVLPVWRRLCAVAHTLPYDYEIVLAHQQCRPLPEDHLGGVDAPVLVIAGGKSPTYMKNAQAAVAAQLDRGRYEELPGETHIVRGKATVPVLLRFFAEA